MRLGFILFLAVVVATQLCKALPEDKSDVRAALSVLGADESVDKFYARRNYDLAWNGSEEASAEAKAALEVLANAAKEGLNPERYRVVLSGRDLAADDVVLSSAVLTYMRDLTLGRPALKAIDLDVALPQRQFDAAQALDDAIDHHRVSEMLIGLAPPFSEYAALRKDLQLRPDSPDAYVIMANMERWRWMPTLLEPDRIVVNVADASLELWIKGQKVLTSRVIVGRPKNPTPILKAEGAGITVNPAWNVPHSIAAKEILPKLKRNPAYLASQDMVLLNGPPGDPQGLHVDWRAIPAGTFPYQIRQAPGARNPLGRIKLELPNRFDVYLHDTPGKSAFSKNMRMLSHGCVRVDKILPLASYALNADDSVIDQISAAIGTGDTQYFPLHKKLPIYILYWTAIPLSDGSIKILPDVYGRDARMIAVMRGSRQEVADEILPCPKAKHV